MPHYPADVIALNMDRDFRLHQLRQEFEAARDEVLDSEFMVVGRGDTTLRAGAPHLLTVSVDEWATHQHTWLNEDGVRQAARRYIIARDFNVFEDGKWQMLYKLTYGGAR